MAALMLVPLLSHRLPVGAQLTAVYVAVAATATLSQFFNPARFAVIAAVVPEPDRAQAFSLSTAASNTAAVIGRQLAAPLLFGFGQQWALAVDLPVRRLGAAGDGGAGLRLHVRRGGD